MSNKSNKSDEIPFSDLVDATRALQIITECTNEELSAGSSLSQNVAWALITLRDLCLKSENMILTKLANPGSQFEAMRDFYYMTMAFQEEIIEASTSKKDLFESFTRSYPQHKGSVPKHASGRSEWLKIAELAHLAQKRGSPWRP